MMSTPVVCVCIFLDIFLLSQGMVFDFVSNLVYCIAI